MYKVAYLLAAYGGRSNDGVDRTIYLRDHLEQLRTVKHHIDAIIIIINTSKQELPEYTEFVRTISEKIGDTPVTILRRSNIGMSYGAYTHAFKKYVNEFDYFILMEDDYLPVEDYFDTTLVNMLKEAVGTAYLCGCIAYGWGKGQFPHAGLSNGIIPSDIIKKVHSSGGFRHSNTIGDGATDGSTGQVIFSQSVLPFGSITDITNRYPLIFYHTTGNRLEYDKHNKAVLLAPHQYLRK